MPRRPHKLVAVAACCALAPLAGCGNPQSDVPLVQVSGTRHASSVTPISGKDFVPDASQDFATAIGGGGSIGVDKEAIGRDKVEKADVYWKLRWIVDVLRDGDPPQDMSDKMSEARKQIDATLQDEYKPALSEVMESLDQAYDAYRAEGDLNQQGVDTHAVAWGTGSVAMESGLSGDKLGKIDPGLPQVGSPKETDGQKRVLEFEAKHHEAPRTTRLAALNRADATLEAVADRMDRARMLAGDHPIGREVKSRRGFASNLPGGVKVKPLPGQSVIGEPVPVK